MDGMTLITPTSDRPEAFKLCERWVKRAIEHFSGGPIQWIVADDGSAAVECTLGQRHVRRRPSPDATRSFLGNLIAALEHVEHEKILFIEDDDWYSPRYLELMSGWLEGGIQIAGEARSKYYNVRTRRYQQCGNRTHSSLCQTGIRSALVPRLLDILRRHATTYVDLDLWKIVAAGSTRRLHPNTLHCIGIKGLPGKNGIGIGHRLDRRCQHDRDGSILRQWVGEDADVYQHLAEQAIRE